MKCEAIPTKSVVTDVEAYITLWARYLKCLKIRIDIVDASVSLKTNVPHVYMALHRLSQRKVIHFKPSDSRKKSYIVKLLERKAYD